MVKIGIMYVVVVILSLLRIGLNCLYKDDVNILIIIFNII